jgi:hypothetical protein
VGGQSSGVICFSLIRCPLEAHFRRFAPDRTRNLNPCAFVGWQ